MALIFAFPDGAGRWYGTPDVRLDGPEQEGILTLAGKGLNGETRTSPFAGRSLAVRYVSVEESPGRWDDYFQLDDGYRLFARRTVDEALFPDS